jgi:hypothetical protein
MKRPATTLYLLRKELPLHFVKYTPNKNIDFVVRHSKLGVFHTPFEEYAIDDFIMET